MRFAYGAVLAAALVCIPPAAQAHGPGHHHGRHCRDCSDGCRDCSDSAGLRTLSGTIGEIDFASGGIVEARLNTPDGPQRVRLADATFLRNNGFALKEGDAIRVTGYRVAGTDGDLFVATEIARGDKRLTLRDRQGRGRW